MTLPRDPTTDELAAGYVLGELSREDAATFERRLAGDPDLAEEVRRLRATLGLLPFATVTEPPAHLRARVLAAGAADVPAPATTRAPRRVVWSRFAAAAAAVLALAFGFDAYRVRRELSLERELAATLHEPNVVRSFALAGTGGAYGTVALDLDAKRGAVVLKGLQQLPAGERYRLWAQVGDRSVFCGEFGASAMGTIVAQFPVPVESYTAPIAKLFLTKESTPRGPEPAGPTVMQSA
jgi:anti-sigma-K factor RskA